MGSYNIRKSKVIRSVRMALLFGDMIFALEQKNSGIIDEANMEALPNAMKNLMYVYNDAKIVIPGHKTWGDFSLLPHTLEIVQNHGK